MLMLMLVSLIQISTILSCSCGQSISYVTSLISGGLPRAGLLSRTTPPIMQGMTVIHWMRIREGGEVFPHKQNIVEYGACPDACDNHVHLFFFYGAAENAPIPQACEGSQGGPARRLMDDIEIIYTSTSSGRGRGRCRVVVVVVCGVVSKWNHQPREQGISIASNQILRDGDPFQVGRWRVQEMASLDVLIEGRGPEDGGLVLVAAPSESGSNVQDPGGRVDHDLGGDALAPLGLEAGALDGAAAIGEPSEGLEGRGDRSELGGVGEGDPEPEIGAEDAAELLGAEPGGGFGDGEAAGDVGVGRAGGEAE